MPIVIVCWMQGDFRRRQSKNQPAVTGIDGREPEHLVEKRPIGFSVGAVDDDVGTGDHGERSATGDCQSAHRVVGEQYPSWGGECAPNVAVEGAASTSSH